MGGGAERRGGRLVYGGGDGGGARFLDPMLQGGADEGGEERMRFEGLGLEFGVELAAQEPRVIGSFDDFDVVFVGGAASDSKTRGDKSFLVFAVELVAVAMALADIGGAVSFIGERTGFEPAGPSTEAHGAAHFVHAQQFAQLVNHAMRGLRIEFRAVRAG